MKKKGDCEIVHEALITQWERLKLWIEESREELILVNQLSQAAELWKKRGKREDDLWSKQALKESSNVLLQAIAQETTIADFVKASEIQTGKERRKLTAILGFMILVVTGSVWAGNHLLRGELCTGATEKIEQVWNPQVKDNISKAFLGTGVSYAKDTVDRVHKLFDEYTNEWKEHYTKACEATHVKGEQSDEVLDLRMVCLRMRLGELGSLANIFSEADIGVIQKAVQASSFLTGTNACADEKALRAPYPSPKTEKAKILVEAIRERLLDVKTLLNTGKYNEGLQLVESEHFKAEQLSYRPLLAETFFWLAHFKD